MIIPLVAALIGSAGLAAQEPTTLIQESDALRDAIAAGAWEQAAAISTRLRAAVAEARDRKGAAAAAKLTDEILNWLPSDTETLVAARQPFILTKNNERRVATSLEGAQAYALGLLSEAEGGTLIDSLFGRTVRMAVVAARQFGEQPASANRPPSLGMIPFQGCGVYEFADALPNPLLERPNDLSIMDNHIWAANGPKGEAENERVLSTRLDEDVLAVCNDRSFLEQMIANRRGAKHKRALPETLPEWKHAWRDAPLWGISHFRNGGTMNAISGDADIGAIGITVAFGLPSGETKARVIARADPWTAFMAAPELQGAASTRKAEDGVWEISISDAPRAAFMIPFVLMAMLGFVVLV